MGLTIHYEGHLKSAEAYEEIIQICKAFSDNEGWLAEMIDERHKSVERVIDEEGIPYEGPMRGIRLYPDPDCEPLTFEFGTDLFCQDWTKTQFAGPMIHRKVVDLLSNLKRFFADLKVVDESDYWTDRDESALEESFRRADEAIRETLLQYPGGSYKVKTPAGRYIDILT